ncbi:MAG: hypothetical protein K2X86_10155 [Cytophagaceae bacterium]|nr:hypothetical protein [Cytophagaceae bacterium]
MEPTNEEFCGMLAIISFVIILIVAVPIIVSYWILFKKAGKPGWAAIIPFYNTLIILEIIKKPWWWLILMLLPYVSIIWHIWSTNLFVKSFGKDTGFTIGVLILPMIFLPILAFDSSVNIRLARLVQRAVIQEFWMRNKWINCNHLVKRKLA